MSADQKGITAVTVQYIIHEIVRERKGGFFRRFSFSFSSVILIISYEKELLYDSSG